MTTKPTILVVEDEEDLRNIIIYNFEREGYTAIGVETGEQGIEQATKLIPDLIILDLMLPGINGMDVCKHLKSTKETQAISIIMVSAKGEEADIVSGLELGADDYVTKPFSTRILLARARAILRRTQQTDDEDQTIITINSLIIDSRKHQVSIDNKPAELTKSEFSILQFLASHRSWVFTRYQIVNAIRGDNYIVTERAIDVQIAGLRKKLGDYSNFIETVRGIGYRFKE